MKGSFGMLDKKQNSLYLKLLNDANINIHDVERKSLLYIISHNEDLFKKRNYIYNFKENNINFNSLNSQNVDLCTSSKALVRLGFNLYNGYTDKYTNPLNIMACLDSKNYIIAKRAIDLRFSI